jgi:glycosyltransferase domain-containing protein
MWLRFALITSGKYRVALLDLSIVIFTYQRQRSALRNMRFWSGRDAQVYVLDGSKNPIVQEHLAKLDVNIKYKHIPIPLLDRLAILPDLINSKYVAFLADDDFFIPSAVESCIAELESCQEVVACFGRSVGKVLISDLIVHQSAINSIAATGVGAVDKDCPIDRIIQRVDPYDPSSFYAVCRSDAWKNTVRSMCAKRYTCVQAAELLFVLSISYYGIIKVIDELMWLRSAENPSCSGAGEFELAFDSWFTDQRYIAEVAEFLDVTANDLMAAGSEQTFIEIRNGLERACNAYVAYCNKAAVGSEVRTRSSRGISPANFGLTGLKACVRKIASTFPDSLVPLLPVRLHFRPYENIAKALESNGVKVNWIEFANILKTVRDFHDEKSKTLLQ